MQIIGGKFRGKKLDWVSDTTTRPTTARVKENIFNILASTRTFHGAKVLVLFAGCGQMGLECFSRGASHIFFNDTSEISRKIIKKNCASVGLDPQISGLDFLACLEELKSKNSRGEGTKFDLVFLDPPYANAEFPVLASMFLCENGMLEKNAVIVVETEHDGLIFKGFSVRKKNYGRARIYFLTPDQNI